MVTTDTDWEDFDDLDNFGISICQSTTRPTAHEGRHIYEADTNKTMVYKGSAWDDVNNNHMIRTTDDATNGLDPLTPLHQYSPFLSGFAIANDYSAQSIDDDPVSGYGNIFQIQSWCENDQSAATVAVFGECLGTGLNSRPWGGNFVAYAKSSTAIAIACELNFGALASGGQAYGLVIASAGDYTPGSSSNFIQVQANTVAAQPQHGIIFNGFGGQQPIQSDGTLILAQKDPTKAYSVAVGIDFSNIAITTTAFAMPNNTNITAKDAGGTIRQLMKFSSSDYLLIGGDGVDSVDMHPGATYVAKFRPTQIFFAKDLYFDQTDPAIVFDTNDYMWYDTSADELNIVIGGIKRAYCDSTGWNNV